MDVDLIGVTAGVEQRRFINVAGAGFDSEVADVAAGMRRRLGSRAHYAIATVKTLPRFVPASFHLDLDGSGRIERRRDAGGGREQLRVRRRNEGPAAGVDRRRGAGYLYRDRHEQGGVPPRFPKVYVGKHATHPNVMMLRGADLKIEANRRVSVFADGEKVGSLPAVFTVLPRRCRSWSARRRRRSDDRRSPAAPRVPAGRPDVGAAARRSAVRWSPRTCPGSGARPVRDVLRMEDAAERGSVPSTSPVWGGPWSSGCRWAATRPWLCGTVTRSGRWARARQHARRGRRRGRPTAPGAGGAAAERGERVPGGEPSALLSADARVELWERCGSSAGRRPAPSPRPRWGWPSGPTTRRVSARSPSPRWWSRRARTRSSRRTSPPRWPRPSRGRRWRSSTAPGTCPTSRPPSRSTPPSRHLGRSLQR